jgi:hypothetical protein
MQRWKTPAAVQVSTGTSPSVHLKCHDLLLKNGVRIATSKANQFSNSHFSILLPFTSRYVKRDILTVYSVRTSHFPIINLLKPTAYLHQQV